MVLQSPLSTASANSSFINSSSFIALSQLNFEPDVDFDLEKLYREIVGSEALVTNELSSSEEVVDDSLGACASVSSRSLSESEHSEPFSPGSSGISVSSPASASTVASQQVPVDIPADVSATMLGIPVRTRVIRIPGYSAKQTIPIAPGQMGFLRDAATGQIYLLKPATEESSQVSTLSSPTIEEIAVDTAAALEDSPECVDVSSPLSTDCCEEVEDSDKPQPLILTGSCLRIALIYPAHDLGTIDMKRVDYNCPPIS
jgi:hypothetical protein